MAHRGGDVAVAEYVLLADHFRQAVARDDKGVVTRTVKRTRGDVLDDLFDDDVERLLKAGAIREVTDDEPAETEPEAVEVPAEHPARDESRPVEQPKRTAPKHDWVEYAVTKGLDRGEAEAMTKDDLMDALR